LVAACLLICPAGGSLAAPPPQDNRLAAADSWSLSPELLAQGAGALVGFGVYSLFVAPQVTVAGGVVAVLGGRLVAATLAGAGAMAGTFVYDRWAGLPLDYAYFWHRGGFIGGVAAGIAAFGLLGYPIEGGASWLGWAANRASILGSGLMGAWAADSLVPGAGSVGQCEISSSGR
jgi:hypothetical protein